MASALNGPVQWLLEPDQPAVRYLALRDLLGRRPDDPDLRESLRGIARRGWAADLLSTAQPTGIWERREPRSVKEYVDFLYYPKYQSSNWKALVLSDLGLTSSDPRIERLAAQLFGYKLRLSSPFNFFTEEVCASGNTARILTRFGYAEDRRVKKLFDWLLEDQREDGGWNCSSGSPGTLDGWEALAAFAVLPLADRSPKMRSAIERGAEFYLERRLTKEGKAYPPWLRLHYPHHYYYDFLVGLDLLTAFGYGADSRLRPALELLKKKQRPDGTWNLERVHPDVSGPQAKQYRKNVTPLALEQPGKRSKWITLLALRVLKRVDEAR